MKIFIITIFGLFVLANTIWAADFFDDKKESIDDAWPGGNGNIADEPSAPFRQDMVGTLPDGTIRFPHRLNLKRGDQGRPMRLEIRGHEEPIPLRIVNVTPSVVQISDEPNQGSVQIPIGEVRPRTRLHRPFYIRPFVDPAQYGVGAGYSNPSTK